MNVNMLNIRMISYQRNYLTYTNDYNKFWMYKIGVEAGGPAHIIDRNHLLRTCTMLLAILPRWKTYRGVICNYQRRLQYALGSIAEDYDLIRNYSICNLNIIPIKPLENIWHALGMHIPVTAEPPFRS